MTDDATCVEAQPIPAVAGSLASTAPAAQIADPTPIRGGQPGPAHTAPPTSNWEAAAALGAIGVTLLATLAMIQLGVDELDEGYFAEQAARVLRGQVPYRDFSSLYTPGLLYLHALVFDLIGGPHLLGLRLVGFAMRVGIALGLYLLARPLVRPAWAALPPLYLLIGLDSVPLLWEPHPGWPSVLGTVAAIGVFAHLPALPERRRPLGLLLVGVLTAIVFAFKQNAGIFLGMATAGFVLLRGLDAALAPASRPLRLVQGAAVLLVLGLLGWLFRPHPNANAFLYVYLLGPIAALGALLLAQQPSGSGTAGLASRVAQLFWLAAGFALATGPWLALLLLALGGEAGHLAAFFGAVELGPLAHPLELPVNAAWLGVLGLGAAALLAVRLGWLGRLAVAAFTLPLVLALLAVTRDAADSPGSALLWLPARAGFGLQAFLPMAALWAGIWLVHRHTQGHAAWRLRWYLVAAAFTFLTQYPRLDNFHLVWSAALPLVVGAVVLGRFHTWLAHRWALAERQRVALGAALLAVPVLVAVPIIPWRMGEVFTADPDTGLPRLAPHVRLDGPRPARGLFVTVPQQRQLGALIDYLQATTAPGEPIFVYPMSPLIYVLADRPNPAPYAHLYPGFAPVTDQARLIANLERQSVRTLVLSDHWLAAWSPPGSNQSLEDYLASRFERATQFGVYRVLTRRDPPRVASHAPTPDDRTSTAATGWQAP